MNPSFKTAKNTLQELNQILYNRHYSLAERVEYYFLTMQHFANLTKGLSNDEKTLLNPLREQARGIYENLNERLTLAKAEATEEEIESRADHAALVQSAEAHALDLAKAAADEEEIERLRVEEVARQTNLLIENISTHIQDLVLSLKVKPQNLEMELQSALEVFKTNPNSNQLIDMFKDILNTERFPKSLSQQCIDAIKTFMNAIAAILSLGYSPRFFQTQNMQIQTQTQDFLHQVSPLLS